MRKILQINKKGKVKKARIKKVMGLQRYGALEMDSKIALIQALIPVGLMHIEELLQQEVVELAGERYKRNGITEYDRWGKQQGSVYITDQKIPITVPRVRDTSNGKEVRLSTYSKFQEPTDEADEKLMKRILYGLSCGLYRECSEAIPGALSLSASTVSRRYIRASSKKLKELMERRLEDYDFIGIVLDGKRFGEDGIIMAIGVTTKGKKMILGIIQSSTENHIVCKEFLNGLIERGLRYDQGLLLVIDGAKGMRKAIQEVFGIYGIVQRCQWHKRENVVSYLPKSIQATYRAKLQSAYQEESYEGAKAALRAIKIKLRQVNESAVRSLEEGLEETLTLHRLGLIKELGRSFKTTNMIESIHALVGQKTDKVDYWKNSNQKHRWVGTSLYYIEKRLNKVNGHMYLKQLREALQKEMNIEQDGKKMVAA